MPYGKIVMASGKEAYFEIEEPYRGQVSAKGVVKDLQESFDSIMDLVQETAESVYEGFEKIPQKARPDEYELAFGLKLSTKAGVVFANVGGEGSFQVILRWTASQ